MTASDLNEECVSEDCAAAGHPPMQREAQTTTCICGYRVYARSIEAMQAATKAPGKLSVPNSGHKTQFNMVEAIADPDEEQAFDQPCRYGNRLGSHSVYCHHPAGIARKCYYRWCDQKTHKENECGGYDPNLDYSGRNEKQ